MRLQKLNSEIVVNVKNIVLLAVFLFLTNFLTYQFSYRPIREPTDNKKLYLLNEAQRFVYDIDAFEKKVQWVSKKLDIPAEWLMSVMHSESKFDASVANYKGSGATGLIQWMPATAKDYNLTVEKIRNMNHIEQLDYVYRYLNDKRQKYGNYESLTDLYLAILYPKAMAEEYCFTLYATPSVAYKMNIGLDMDKDGRVTIQDIDKRMKKKYPIAYMVNMGDDSVPGFTRFFGAFGKNK